MGKDKKHKKEKRKKLKKEKRRRSPSNSSSESSEGEWVEKDAIAEKLTVTKPVVTGFETEPTEREDVWGSIFSGVSTSEIRKAKEAEKAKVKESCEVKPGHSSRELNPYWKDGGTGLPPERPSRSDICDARKSFDSQSRTDDVEKPHSNRFRKPDDDYSNHSRNRFKKPDEDDHGSRRDGFRKPSYDSESRSSISGFRKPHDSEEKWSREARKPDDNERRRNVPSSSNSYRENSSKSRGWRKNNAQNDCKLDSKVDRRSPSPVKETVVDKSPSPEFKVLTSDELNSLTARIMRAEMAGYTDLAAKLKKQLENSRREDEGKEKTIILTQTDSRGYTRPVKQDNRGHGSKNKRKIQTHEDKKRVRYFADDDDYSLQEMYEKEKYSSAHDQEASFMNLMGKEMARKDGSLALDDPFEETASIDDRNKKDKQQWDRAVREQAKKEKIYDECKWCFGTKRMDQKLVIKTKQKVYLSCPPFQSLTEGHCLIIPHSHITCSTQADEDVWDEVMELRKEVVRVLEKNDEDVVFFEMASRLHKYPHMIIHCVPVPREIGDVAPIYFKKALLDCESEWTSNKKVVELAGRGVRKAVPKGLPYFFVDFGDQAGYAHVIEDQRLFPHNFAQEVIGGMLDLDHGLWRKQKNISEDELKKNIDYLNDLMKDT